MSQYLLLVASLGRYRLRTLQMVQRILGEDFSVAAGTLPYDRSIKVLTPDDLPMLPVRNFFGPAGLLWQMLPWRRSIGVEVLVTDLNPRVLSGWLLLLIRFVLRKRTLLWGHAYPRAGRAARSEFLRGLMRRLASGVICYTRTQADQLRKHYRRPVYSAPNALYFREEMGFDSRSTRTSVVYVGRLVAEKKVSVLMEAFALAARDAPSIRLVIVGDGDEADALHARAHGLPCSDRIVFRGHVDDVNELREIYSHGFVSVSPGPAGLAITQTLAFGVPMLLSRAEQNGPEIEAAREGENSAFFRSDDPRALADGLLAFYRDRQVWRARGPEIAEACAHEYSVEAMADGLVAAIVGR